MLALARRRIANVDAQSQLEAYASSHFLQSKSWLMPCHEYYFGVKCMGIQKLKISTDSLVDRELSAFPFSHLPLRTQKLLLNRGPPPPPLGMAPLIISRSTEGDDLIWRSATADEYLDSTFYQTTTKSAHDRMLCSCTVAQCDAPANPTVTLVNAQETSNPFRVDSTLTHLNLETGQPLPDAVQSGLTTVMAQFGYISMKWVAENNVIHSGCRVKNGETSRTVTTLDPIYLAHVSQLPLEKQTEMMSSMPRYVLTKAMTQPFIYINGRWEAVSHLGLIGRLGELEVPETPGIERKSQPLLWVHQLKADTLGCTLIQRARHFTKRYYNVAQLTGARNR